MWTDKFQMYKLDLEKAEETEIKLPEPTGSQRKQGNSRKTSISASLTKIKPLTLWITTNCGQFFKWWEYQTALPFSWECYVRRGQEATVRTRHGSTDYFKFGKEYKTVYCQLAYSTSMQSTSCKMLGCNQDFQEKYRQPHICRCCYCCC